MSQSLLLFDTDRIKRYVFATDKLREIRAASAILDRLNRQVMVDTATQRGGQKVYANGGRGLFLADTDQLDEIMKKVAAKYRAETFTASVTGVAVNGLEAVDWADTLISPQRELLDYTLQMTKDSQERDVPLLSHSFLNYCRSCGVEYAVDTVTENGQPKLVCPSCKKKVDYDSDEIKEKIQGYVAEVTNGKVYEQADGLWPYLITKLHQPPQAQQQDYRSYLSGYERPERFDDLAELSRPTGYLALIYADGDAMGQQLEKICTLQQMQDFADTVDNSIYDATVEAIRNHLRPRSDQKKKQWPFDILLLGGDDLVMVTRAESALEVALAVMQRFSRLANQGYTDKYQTEAPEECRPTPLHVSVAVTIAHANFPFGELLRLTESSLKFAKKAAAERRQQDDRFHEGMLNFLVVSSANHLDFKRYYNDQLRVDAEYNSLTPSKLYRSLRPYTAAKFEKLLKAARLLKELNTPRTKLEQLRALLFQTRRQAMVDALSLLFHWRSERQRRAIQKIVADFSPEESQTGLQFPWFQIDGEKDKNGNQTTAYFTPLLDLIEIYDFIGDEE